MTRIEALEELAAKVKAGDAHAVDIAARRMASEARDQGGSFPALWVLRAHNGSLDAALAFHNAVLPGWRYTLRNWGKVEVFTEEWNDENTNPKQYKSACVRGNLARAWLLAILRALIAQEKAK